MNVFVFSLALVSVILGFIYLIIGGMYIDTLSTLEASKGSL